MTDMIPRARVALSLLHNNPSAWFRDATIEPRDRELIAAEPVSFLDYSARSYLRKIYHMKAGENFKMTNWMVETDDECKELVRSAGAKLYGYDKGPSPSVHWASVTVNVNVWGGPRAGFEWGFLSTTPDNIRIFKGPAHCCPLHACEAMILRSCSANTDTLGLTEGIGDRMWDILCMRMGQDYDYPWVVVAVKDAGPLPELDFDTCGCQDPSACGCIIEHEE
ncbi:uncharacterized protein PV07_07084 [Cladophialophora immunda]|uniref:Uncharacterized protein n=1 Tax=Cladophialophora immunda TaxID=569365 RepID=A0A0D1ZHA2_9EURO|nr:uncharacterized protein PV07_07084 [Cladophialophora immunda]KIW27336.1 hypothetical protein PV07_07084 [Cladophialophora immunda]